MYSCNNLPYNPSSHSCHGNQTYSCGNLPYNPATHFCSRGKIEQAVPRCGGSAYNGKTHFCHDDEIYAKCGGTIEYTPGTEACCGTGKYTVATHFCSRGKIEQAVPRCGGSAYNGKTHFCHEDEIYAKCDGTVEYTPGIEACCGAGKFVTATQFCFNGSKVGDKCGINPQTYYNPNLYECKPSVNPNGIFLKEPVSYEGEIYEAVLIGDQIWMAENLNYNATGSRCYGDNTGNDSQNRCVTYGRLYNWNVALTVCPSGWHLPSNAEWTALTNHVGTTPGTKLKASSGWSGGGNGTDEFGFSALPGGVGYPDGYFYNVGDDSHWWSATEDNASFAWRRNMYYYSGNAGSVRYGKSNLLSVRCVKSEP
jgi:uncharacterized protein (TIGR02145 family)